MDEELGSDIYLDGIVTVTDAKYGLEQLNDPNLVEDIDNAEEKESSDLPTNTAKKQIALADLILLNKLDMVSEEQKVNVKRALEAVNASAPIIETKFSQIPLEKILDMNAYGNEMPEKIPSESSQHIDKSIGTGIHTDILFLTLMETKYISLVCYNRILNGKKDICIAAFKEMQVHHLPTNNGRFII